MRRGNPNKPNECMLKNTRFDDMKNTMKATLPRNSTKSKSNNAKYA
jgi:hypothetical protein